MKKGAETAPPSRLTAVECYRFFAAFFFAPFAAFFAICIPPFTVLECAGFTAPPQHTLPPGTSGLDVGDSRLRSTPETGAINSVEKKGCSCRAPPIFERRNYRFFAAFFLAPLAAFFAILFSSGIQVVVTQPRRTNAIRHNWWAEPSTLIPDVDYG